jgi:hypothetical protein
MIYLADWESRGDWILGVSESLHPESRGLTIPRPAARPIPPTCRCAVTSLSHHSLEPQHHHYYDPFSPAPCVRDCVSLSFSIAPSPYSPAQSLPTPVLLTTLYTTCIIYYYAILYLLLNYIPQCIIYHIIKLYYIYYYYYYMPLYCSICTYLI